MFGKDLKYVLALTALALMTYTLPSVQAALSVNMSGSMNSAATINSSISRVEVKNISTKVVYDSKRSESAVKVTAKVQINAGESGLTIQQFQSFHTSLNNKNLKIPGRYIQMSVDSADISMVEKGVYVIKPYTKAVFNVSTSFNPASMIAGQYSASLDVVLANEMKLQAPKNNSNIVTIIGENSPYISLMGASETNSQYGMNETVIVRGVRLEDRVKVTIQEVNNIVCEIDQTCMPKPLFSKTFTIKNNDDRSHQFRIKLSDYGIPAGMYNMYVTNTKLGDVSGKSNIVWFSVLNQSKIIDAKVTAGKLALSYDGAQKESSLSATFEVTLKGSDYDLTLDQWSFGAYAETYFSSGSSYGYYTQISPKLIVNGQVASFPYVLKANKEVKIVVKASLNPQILPAGSYTMSLAGIYPRRDDGSTESITVPTNRTNSVVIVGEVSPYINTVTTPIKVGEKMVISGVRFLNNVKDSMTVYVDGSMLDVSFLNVSGTEITFVLGQIADGYHSLSIGNVYGRSNSMFFEVIGSTNESNISILSPKKGDVISYGVQTRIDWAGYWNGTDTFAITEMSPMGKDSIVGRLTQEQAGCSGVGKGVCSFMWTPQNYIGTYQIVVTKNSDNPSSYDNAYSGMFTVVASTTRHETSLIGTDVAVSAGDESQGEIGSATISFKIYSPNEDLYISKSLDYTSTSILSTSATDTSTSRSVSIESMGTEDGQYYVVRAGETTQFKVNVSFGPVPVTGMYRVRLNQIKTSSGNILFGSEFVTNYVSLNSNTVITPIIETSTSTVSVQSTVTATCYQFSSNLSRGDEGKNVLALQEFLISKGFLSRSGVTSSFNIATKEALMKYQTSVGLKATGSLDTVTRTAVNSCK